MLSSGMLDPADEIAEYDSGEFWYQLMWMLNMIERSAGPNQSKAHHL